MYSTNFSEFQQTRSANRMPGFWKLAAGRVLSLQPRQAGVLRVAQGRAWATLGTQSAGHGNELGDHVLQARQGLVVQAGQHLVFEALGRHGEPPVFFEWTPLEQPASAPQYHEASVVTRPLGELGQALGMAGAALVRLCAGVVAYGRQRALGRASVPVSHCG